MATLQSLSDRLRLELGDQPRSFSETIIANGVDGRYQLSYYPLYGATLTVKVNGVNVSSSLTVEDFSGMLILNSVPANNAVIIASGTYYRYFTEAEIANYINIAFLQHSGTDTTTSGSKITLTNLPGVEEYPVILLASTLALYTLATDTAYDIDIMSPDGVNIPRSERYRQLTDLIAQRKEQYRELCSLLDIGLHRIEVATVRRIMQRTNRYAPTYLPQEVDDPSPPKRLQISIPTYMDKGQDAVLSHDFTLYQEDSYSFTVDFPFSLVGYNLLAQIRLYAGSPIIIETFNIVVTNSAAGTVTLSLTSNQTRKLPRKSQWDLQLTSSSDANYQKTYIKGVITRELQVTSTNNDPYASGWRG